MRRTAVAVMAALALAPAAQAASKGPVFGLRAVGAPLGYYVYSLSPGAVKRGVVIVSNVGNAPGTVKLFTADGTTGPTSGTVYKTDVRPTQAGAWVTLSSTTLTLAPGAHRKLPFTVRVPAGASSGQWVAGIVAETSQKVAAQKPGQKARVQIKIRDLTIVAVQVNVPGPPKIAFAVGGVTTGGTRGFQKVFVHLASTSNVLARPRGSVTIFDKAGKLVETLPFKLDTFLPRTAIDYPILLKKALAPGDYQALVKLTVPAVAGARAATVTARPAFSVSSADVKQVFSSAQPTQKPPGGLVASSSSGASRWAYAAAAAGAVVILLLLWLLLRRRRRAAPTPAAAPSRAAQEVAAPPPPPPPPAPATEDPPAVEPLSPAPVPEPELSPLAAAPPPMCEHNWDVSYDRGHLGEDGIWRFPHRCRTCGFELLARDVADADEQTQR
jgi:hypothetical protein